MRLLFAAVIWSAATGAGDEPWRKPALEVAPPPPNTDFEFLRNSAFKYVGRPYVMGGVGRPAFDCSGYVCRVFAESGYAIPRVSRDQARAGEAVPLDALEPGDLLFFAAEGEPISHVGLYLGDGEIIHASSGRGQVTVARLSAQWFQDHLVEARRVLGGERDAGLADVSETREHAGRFRLLPMLRVPARRPAPSFGPELVGTGYTSLGGRAVFLTEAGEIAFTLVPEVTFAYRDWGLEITVALPVRFPFDREPTIGTFDAPRDYVRFLRTLRLGLPDADLEIVLSRLGDLTLGSGAMVDHIAPGTTVEGIPGLTVGYAPLATTFGLRGETGFVRAVLDDPFDPAFVGLGGGLTFDWFTFGVSGATDQKGLYEDLRERIYGVEAFAQIHILDTASWSLDLGAQGQVLTALGDLGGTAEGSLRAQYRFGEVDSVSIDFHGGYLGPRSLRGLFGPTYLADRELVTEGLVESGGRVSLGGDVRVIVGKWQVAVGYSEALGTGIHPLDRSVRALFAIEGLSLGSTRLLDIRAVYAARAFARREDVAQVAQAGLRLWFNTWLGTEAYFQLGTRGDGGAGVTLLWTP